MHVSTSLELTYNRIMVHAYPHLSRKLETQTLGLFYYHKLIPGLQDIVPIAIYLVCVSG